MNKMDLDLIWAADYLKLTHKHFIKACDFPESIKRRQKISNFPSIPKKTPKEALSAYTHPSLGTPPPSTCAHAGKRMSEHPYFELISVLTHRRNVHLGKQPPRYLRA